MWQVDLTGANDWTPLLWLWAGFICILALGALAHVACDDDDADFDE
jgi:hypothetical protein